MVRELGSFWALGAAVFALAACSQASTAGTAATVAPNNPKSATLANGESIFRTGRDLAGNQIAAAKPPLRPSCAACHLPSGAGGVHLPGGAVSADLRHNALVVKQKHPYTLALLERAISKGIDNDGKPLDPVMPRWKLSQTDLHDVASYVLTRLK